MHRIPARRRAIGSGQVRTTSKFPSTGIALISQGPPHPEFFTRQVHHSRDRGCPRPANHQSPPRPSGVPSSLVVVRRPGDTISGFGVSTVFPPTHASSAKGPDSADRIKAKPPASDAPANGRRAPSQASDRPIEFGLVLIATQRIIFRPPAGAQSGSGFANRA